MRSAFSRFNWLIFVAMLALAAIGTVFIWSAGNARVEAVFHDMWINNLITVGVGLVVYLIAAFGDYRRYLPILAVPAYAMALLLLLAVLVFGEMIYGGRRWLWFFQPSEISKLGIIAFFASMLGSEGARYDSFLRGLGCMLLLAVPALLIVAEPDLGTTLTLVPSVMMMFFLAGAWRRYLTLSLAVVAVVAIAILGAVGAADNPKLEPSRREAILKWVPLKNHQIKRLKVFLSPESDVMGAGYTLRQSKLAIGSGGFRGKGIGRGESSRLKYLPQSISMNDFIFCVYAEETGYVGSLTLLALYALLLLPCGWIAWRAEDDRGRLFALGFSTLVFAHVFINIAMAIGIVPITGLPLPFISSGRTFLMTVMAGLGIIQSISIHGRSDR